MHRWGADSAYLALAVGHLIGFVLLGQLRTAGGVSTRERTSLTQTFVDYAAEITRNRALLGLVLIGAAVNMFGFSFSSALPELTIGRLGGGAVELGYLHAVRAVGGSLAMAAFALWGAKYRLRRLYVTGLFGFALGLMCLGFSPGFWGGGLGASAGRRNGLAHRRPQSSHDAVVCCRPSAGAGRWGRGCFRWVPVRSVNWRWGRSPPGSGCNGRLPSMQ